VIGTGAIQTVDIVGHICETSDLLAKDILLPNMEQDDLLAINDVISPPLPVETSDGRQVDCFIRSKRKTEILKHLF